MYTPEPAKYISCPSCTSEWEYSPSSFQQVVFFPLSCCNPTLKKTSSKRAVLLFHIGNLKIQREMVGKCCFCFIILLCDDCVMFIFLLSNQMEGKTFTQTKRKLNKKEEKIKEKEMCSKHKDHRHCCSPSQQKQSSPPSGYNPKSQTPVSQIYGVLFVRHPHLHFLHVICRHAAWKILLPLTALRLLHTAFCKLWGRKKESARWQ